MKVSFRGFLACSATSLFLIGTSALGQTCSNPEDPMCYPSPSPSYQPSSSPTYQPSSSPTYQPSSSPSPSCSDPMTCGGSDDGGDTGGGPIYTTSPGPLNCIQDAEADIGFSADGTVHDLGTTQLSNPNGTRVKTGVLMVGSDAIYYTETTTDTQEGRLGGALGPSTYSCNDEFIYRVKHKLQHMNLVKNPNCAWVVDGDGYDVDYRSTVNYEYLTNYSSSPKLYKYSHNFTDYITTPATSMGMVSPIGTKVSNRRFEYGVIRGTVVYPGVSWDNVPIDIDGASLTGNFDWTFRDGSAEHYSLNLPTNACSYSTPSMSEPWSGTCNAMNPEYNIILSNVIGSIPSQANDCRAYVEAMVAWRNSGSSGNMPTYP